MAAVPKVTAAFFIKENTLSFLSNEMSQRNNGGNFISSI
jgi:hypothetical protein